MRLIALLMLWSCVSLHAYDADFNSMTPAMASVQVVLVPPVGYANNATLAPGLVLNWNVVGSRLDFQAVYSGVAW
jgi:hypothetical protein